MSSPSSETAERWNRTLRHFRFVRAHGGHANDFDGIFGCIELAGGEAGLLELCRKLGVVLERIPPDKPRRVTGVAYNSADWGKYADPIAAYPDYEQPGFVRLFGMPVHLGVRGRGIDLVVSGADGNVWSVTERDFKHALELERRCAALGIRLAAR